MEEIASKPVANLFWNSKNVYKELSPYLSSVSYTDNEAGKADEVSITLDNASGIWFNDWYPQKGDTLRLYIGYQGSQFDTGEFQIDDITLSGPPNQIEIKAISTGITKALRTRNNKAFEKQTLRQIAMYFANKNGWQLIKTDNKLSDILIRRKTQENKTDLAFLSEIAKEYGFIFTVKGNKMAFMEHSALDRIASVISIGMHDMENYSLQNKTYGTYAASTVKTLDRKTGQVIQSTVKSDDPILYGAGTWYTGDPSLIKPAAVPEWQKDTGSTDVLNQSGAVTSLSEANVKAKAGLSESNRKQQTGNISLPGNPLLVAGVNFDLEGFGKASGKYHITKSTHKIDTSGYKTSIDIEKVADIEVIKAAPKKSKAKTKNAGDYKSELIPYSKTIIPYGAGTWYMGDESLIKPAAVPEWQKEK